MPIKDEIFARMDELSRAEKKVARTLLASYPSAGLQSAAMLARAVGTSTPTVLRLVTRLGIGSYPDFQERLREEITHHMNSPVARTEQGRQVFDEPTAYQRTIAEKVALIEGLGSSVPPSEFAAAVTALASRPKQVFITGGYFSRYFAMLLASQLDQVIPNVDFGAEPLGHDIGKYFRLSKGSVAIILDMRRYELAASEAAAMAKRLGATTIVITDQGLSPAAESADIVLPVAVDGIPFDSMVGLLVLVEALVAAVLGATGSHGIDRMKQWEDSVRIARASRADDSAPDAARQDGPGHDAIPAAAPPVTKENVHA